MRFGRGSLAPTWGSAPKFRDNCTVALQQQGRPDRGRRIRRAKRSIMKRGGARLTLRNDTKRLPVSLNYLHLTVTTQNRLLLPAARGADFHCHAPASMALTACQSPRQASNGNSGRSRTASSSGSGARCSWSSSSQPPA